MRRSGSHTNRRKSGRERGFTIIELLIVVAVVAILITIAAPSLRTMIIGNQVRSLAGDLVNDLAVARSEASKRSQRVVMCPSNNQNTCTSGATWAAGWIAFVDANTDQQRNTSGTTEPLIRVREAPPTSMQITYTSNPSEEEVRFRAIGIIGAAKTFTICPSATGSGAAGRRISLTAMGRVEVVNITCP